MKIEFEDGLKSFKIIFLKTGKVLFLIFKSKLFHLMAVDGKKEFIKKFMFTTEEENLIVSSCIICFANARKYFEDILRRLTFKPRS